MKIEAEIVFFYVLRRDEKRIDIKRGWRRNVDMIDDKKE